MRFHIYLIFILFIFTISCKNNSSETKVPLGPAPLDTTERKIGKAIFYLENSGSMFGYVNGFTEYVDVVSELAEKPEFAEHQTPREFNFVNGGQNLKVTNIGSNPTSLKDKLNIDSFNCGDVSKSNLNSMFQLALSRAKNDTISILISDAIYDIGKPSAPLGALFLAGRVTRSRFIERLNEGDLQTIIIKLNSHFDGKYFPVTGGSVNLSQNRPYYIWIFGETELLNQYFTDEYIKSLKGFTDIARFLKLSELEVPYQATAHKKVGDFKFDNTNKNKLVSVKTDRHGQGFQFTMAVDYSELPFSETYLTDTSNYSCNNSNYSIRNVSSIGDVELFGLDFEPTHIVTIGTDKSPHCQLEISLKNNVPNWIVNTNSVDESNIIGDTTHTFGFKFLTNGISEAYQHVTNHENAASFKIEISNNRNGSFSWGWLLFLALLIIGGIIIYNNKK